ncbi:TniQ family protein [Phyllobacterium phragmitis]|uniref:TniQ family protein n=1 Tax=Phyllobacterium phragmitis TaxID=2670329 RepID=A0ABQ0GYZ5_9HYPH
MNALPVPVTLHPDESALGYLSRVAAANGAGSLRDLCDHMGVSYREVVGTTFHRQGTWWAAVQRLAERIGVDPGQLQGRWLAGPGGDLNIGRGRVQRRLRLRACPSCLLDDTERGIGRVAARPYHRVAWTPWYVRTCHIHHVPLVVVGDENPPKIGYDFSLAVSPPGLVARLGAAERRLEPSPLVSFLYERLSGSAASGFLATLPTDIAAGLTEVIGAMVVHGDSFDPSSLSPAQWHEAGIAGFGVTGQSEQEFTSFLDDLVARRRSTLQRRSAGQMYGTLYGWLRRCGRLGSRFDPLHSLVRDHALENLPIGPRDSFLGEVTERRLHSVHTLAREHKVHPKLLRKLLKANGLLPADAAGTDDMLVIGVAEATEFMQFHGSLITGAEARQRTGLGRGAWDSVLKAGLIKPSLVGHKIRTRFRDLYSSAAVDEFVRRACASASRCSGEGRDFLPLELACKHAHVSQADALRLLLDGKVKAARIAKGKKGLRAIEVCLDELVALTHPEVPDGISLRKVEQALGTTTATVRALVDGGHLPFRLELHSANGRRNRYVAAEDLEAFAARYITLRNLASRTGRQIGKLHAEISASGVKPAFDLPSRCARFYERASVARWLGDG